jgi:hypothetical protein
MSDHPSNSDWFEEKLASTRRSVRKLEIDACRIRTDLARLEAANATGIVIEDLVPTLGDESPAFPDVEQPLLNGAPEEPLDWQSAATPLPEGMDIRVGAPADAKDIAQSVVPPQEKAETVVAELSPETVTLDRSRGLYRRATSPVMASLIVHGAILFLAVSVTVATFDRNDPRFTTTTLKLNPEAAKPPENFEVQQLADLGETAAHDGISGSPAFDSAVSLSQDPIPIDIKSVEGPESVGRMGTSNSIPTDLGTLMTGVGGLSADGTGAPSGIGSGNQRGRGGGGRPGGSRNSNRMDSTFFFGTEARGDRFVFVVDNSSSMKGGRLERAVAELVKTVDAMSTRQNFYVIFVSDQTYPMFYPQQEPAMVPATPANKKRLAEWAPKAILASGKNRELIKAMDLAATMQPQAVYLLWDGDLRYSEKVRMDVVTHLTRPNQWNFIVHTLGMGITSLESEQNLRVIAQAHRGIYRRIDVPAARTR